jgi:hypothetical protein
MTICYCRSEALFVLILPLYIWISAEIGKGPGLKAQHFGINFRGLKASAPSDLAIYNCSPKPLSHYPARKPEADRLQGAGLKPRGGS